MSSIFKTSLLRPLLFLFFIGHAYAQKQAPYATQIDSLLQTNQPKFNGVILIAQQGKTVYAKAHGLANIEAQKPLTLTTPFEIMSNSKQIAAVLILLEVEKGKIDLNSPIKKYLPQLTQSWADSVTVHQLLNHSHGIIDLQKPLAFKPGTNFKYGNLNFSLLGKIVEFSTKKSYTVVANALFKKLKMKATFAFSKENTQDLASGYINKNDVFEMVKNSLITPENLGADGIVSTVNDLKIWNNNLHKGKILKPETYKLMITPDIDSQHNFFGKELEGYGYGIRITEKEVVKYIGHTGLGDGFSSVNLYFPKSDVSLIILENQMNENPDLFYASEFKIKNLLLKSDLLHQKQKDNGKK